MRPARVRPLTGRPARVRPLPGRPARVRPVHGRPPKNGAKNSEVHTYHNQGLGGTQGAQRMNLGE